MSDRPACDIDDAVEVECSVLGYLDAHPDAADTLDGIITWWLPLQRYENARARIERVLAHLVDRGVLRRDRLPDGAELYALGSDAGRPPRSH